MASTFFPLLIFLLPPLLSNSFTSCPLLSCSLLFHVYINFSKLSLHIFSFLILNLFSPHNLSLFFILFSDRSPRHSSILLFPSTIYPTSHLLPLAFSILSPHSFFSSTQYNLSSSSSPIRFFFPLIHSSFPRSLCALTLFFLHPKLSSCSSTPYSLSLTVNYSHGIPILTFPSPSLLSYVSPIIFLIP